MTKSRTQLPVLVAFVLSCIGLAAAPALLGEGDLRLVIEILTVFTFAQSWNLLAGFVGLMSFGQFLFIGLGAYFVFTLSNASGINPFVLIPLAFVFCAAVAAAIAPLVFRLRDAYFAISIWVLAEIVRLYTSQADWLGSVSGLSLEGTRGMNREVVVLSNYGFAAGLALISVFGLHILSRSRLGLALAAVRDNEGTAAAIGLNVWRIRLVGFALSSGVVGMAGAAYYTSVFHLDPGAAYDANWMVVMLFIVIIGGVGTIEGPIIGTAIYFLFRAWFSGTGNLYLMLLGAAAVVTMLAAPKGLWGVFTSRTGLHLFSARHHPPEIFVKKDTK
jgi:branched-chain amino acid transport system permease protein